MVQAGQITQEQAKRLAQVAMADDLCLEADSGGHTDGGVAYVLMPAITRLRDDMMKKYEYKKKVRVGAAGGIGTPEAAAAAFMLGADFIVTGSINQCTVEAGTSNNAKDMLEQINIQDTTYAPAGDMFELGAKVQVLKKVCSFQHGLTSSMIYIVNIIHWKRLVIRIRSKFRKNISSEVLMKYTRKLDDIIHNRRLKKRN